VRRRRILHVAYLSVVRRLYGWGGGRGLDVEQAD
jgi:hypothetical protein